VLGRTAPFTALRGHRLEARGKFMGLLGEVGPKRSEARGPGACGGDRAVHGASGLPAKAGRKFMRRWVRWPRSGLKPAVRLEPESELLPAASRPPVVRGPGWNL